MTLKDIEKIAKNNVWHLFVIRLSKRNDLIEHMNKSNIHTLIHYPIPSHKQKAYSELNHVELPITEMMAKEILSLPISPVMSDAQVSHVINTVNKFK